MNTDEKRKLLVLARKSIDFYLTHGRCAAVEELDFEITPGVSEIMGGFVTLHENGQLRGCIGEIFPSRELYKVVLDRAVDSAVNDYRFHPLSKDELDLVVIEISALSMPKAVDSWKDIIIGKHGMTLEKNGRSAVFLPQVAPEQGWNIEECLTHLSIKAGLPPNAWKKDCSFQVFEAIVFSES